MNGEELKSKVHGGGIIYGTMLSMSQNPRWTTTMSAFGLDYVVIDTEHSPRGRDDIADFLAAFNYSGVVPIVRIPIPSSHYVTMALDAGAQGILAPYCESARRRLEPSMVGRRTEKEEDKQARVQLEAAREAYLDVFVVAALLQGRINGDLPAYGGLVLVREPAA